MRLELLFIAVLVAGGSPRAAIIPFYVDALNGSDANNGSSPALAWKTLTHALNVVGSPPPHNIHEIRLLPGVYDEANGETFPIVLKQGRWLASVAGAQPTILGSTTTPGPMLRILVDTQPGFPTQNSAVRGLTLRGGNPCVDVDDSGAGQPLQQYVILEGIEFAYAPGPKLRVFQRNLSNVTLVRSHFSAPASHMGIEVLAGDLRVEDAEWDWAAPLAHVATVPAAGATVSLRRIRARGGSGLSIEPQAGSLATSVRLEDSHLSQTTNAAVRAVGAAGSALELVVERSTIRGALGGGVVAAGCALTLHDSILWGSAGDVRLESPAPSVSAAWCLIGDGTFAGQSGCFAADPLFRADGTLSASSPAVDAADPASSMATLDLTGRSRGVDGDFDTLRHPDLGAVEFRPLEVGPVNPGGTLLVSASGPEGAPVQVWWTRGHLSPAPYATSFGLIELQRDRAQLLTSLLAGDATAVIWMRAVPADPALVGRTFAFQARVATGWTPTEAWTNAVQVTVTP
ncbi:MAG: DUF1565 domain-containing protein [Planctomycetes bacterium]|nr:DUF1565 domain-containing protein [Planctomycetota bacterium]